MKLSNQDAKYDFENVTCVDLSKFSEKADLTSLKSDINEVDIDKLETTPADLRKQCSKK